VRSAKPLLSFSKLQYFLPLANSASSVARASTSLRTSSGAQSSVAPPAPSALSAVARVAVSSALSIALLWGSLAHSATSAQHCPHLLSTRCAVAHEPWARPIDASWCSLYEFRFHKTVWKKACSLTRPFDGLLQPLGGFYGVYVEQVYAQLSSLLVYGSQLIRQPSCGKLLYYLSQHAAPLP